jgi:thioester reductase-like protein
MSDRLKELLERNSKKQMSNEERESQRKSFAYGNTKFENEQITRETVERASRNLTARHGNQSK